MTLTNESSYLPSSTAELPDGPWLVLAPHPDDEAFGMGGTLLLAQAAKISVDIIFLTDGRAADLTDTDLPEKREREAKKVCKQLDIRNILFWREADRGLSTSQHLVNRLSGFIEKNHYTTVFFPSPQEPHPDHRTAAVLAWESLRQLKFSAEPVSYEISLQGYTNKLIDITHVMAKKKQIMAFYGSQMRHNHYIDRILGLNQARAWSLPLSVSHAEAFYAWPKEDRPLNAILLSIASQQTSLQALPDSLPLVSVITRTQNRPEFLREAIRSVASQTYPNIELIVVNDGGPDCEQLVKEESTGHIQHYHYQQLEEQTGRAHAANVGLDCCKGEFIIFLDDDDWFLPEHIEKLVTEMAGHPDKLVAYTAVQCMNSEKQNLEIQFKTPFNATLLIASNYIPIHAVLFSRKLLQSGCRVDESFEVYEDWDFWIQASMITDFLFVEGFSAIYRITENSGFGVNADRQIAQKTSLVLFNKWLPRLPQDKLIDLMRCVQENYAKDQLLRNKDQEITEKDAIIAQKDQEITEKDAIIAQKDQEITDKDSQIKNLNQKVNILQEESHHLQTSTSWKITKPLRCLGRQVKRVHYIYRITSDILKSDSGFVATAKKLLHIVQKEGLQGLKHRLKSIDHKITRGSTLYKNEYEKWVHLYDTLNDDDRKRIKSRIEKMPKTPLISIIMPCYDPPVEFLDAAIWSVRNQLYVNWELCIADDASKNPAVHELLRQHAYEDKRIKVVFREENGHISKASNSSLDLATGEFIALMDNDDTLSEHALFWVAETINQNPDAALIYSDEDKLSEKDGSRIDPYFKCDWNPELFLGHNLITHLGVYKTSIVKEIGGFRVGFEGAQDYDMAARYIERIKPEQIYHIPRILYHWRVLPGSTAKSIDDKPYAAIASEKALNEHLTRCNIKGQVTFLGYGHRIQFDLPKKRPLVSIIIPTRNGFDYVKTCVTSIFSRTTYPNFEIILVDNGSDDALCLAYFSQLEEDYPNFRIIRDNNPFNYSALNNLAVKAAKGEIIALLNNDIEVISPDWLEEMVSIALQPGVGAVGAKLLYPDNTLQHAGIILGIGGWAGHAHKGFPAASLGYVARAGLMQNFSAVTGACLLICKEKFLEVGGLNEVDLAVACNDVDLCLKLKAAGYRNIWTPFATLYHHESATRGYEDTDEKKKRFMMEVSYMKNQWGDILHNDPAYNPNLTLSHEDFSLAWPPRVEAI